MSSTMFVVAHVLVGLACVSHGRRVRTTSEQMQGGLAADHQKLQDALAGFKADLMQSTMPRLQSSFHPTIPGPSIMSRDSTFTTGRKPVLGLGPKGGADLTHNPATLGNLLRPASRFGRFSTAMNAGGAVLERQRAPPSPPAAPPPPGGRGGGGGSGGHGGEEFRIRKMSGPAAEELLDAWIARTRLICLSAQFGESALAEKHKKFLVELVALRSLTAVSEGGIAEHGFEGDIGVRPPAESLMGQGVAAVSKDAFFVALESVQKDTVFNVEKGTVLALAGGSVGAHVVDNEVTGALVIKHVAVSPLEVDNNAAQAVVGLVQGLHQMADNIGFQLVLPSLDE